MISHIRQLVKERDQYLQVVNLHVIIISIFSFFHYLLLCYNFSKNGLVFIEIFTYY